MIGKVLKTDRGICHELFGEGDDEEEAEQQEDQEEEEDENKN
jgi:hypothetical protein